MSEPTPRDGSQSGLQPGGNRDHRSRSERRSRRLAARRRRRTARLLYVLAPPLMIFVVAAALLLLLGDSRSETPNTGSSVPTTTAEPGGGSALLLLEQDRTTVSALLFHPVREDGVVLGIPGLTLLRNGHEFSTVTALGGTGAGEDGRSSALARAISSVLGISVTASAWVEWPGLRAALESVGIRPLPPLDLAPSGAEAGRVAEAVATGLNAVGAQRAAALWERVTLGGEAAAFREAVAPSGVQAVAVVGSTVWAGAALQGRVAGEAGGRYLEPDIGLARKALAGVGETTPFTVELQNGSGALGVTDRAGAMLADLGYRLLPSRNADGFPNVQATRIIAAPDAVLQAELVQRALAVGTILSDDSLSAGRIVVVLGRDFFPTGASI